MTDVSVRRVRENGRYAEQNMTAVSAAQARRAGVCSGLIRLDFYLPSSVRRTDSDMSATFRGSGRVGDVSPFAACA